MPVAHGVPVYALAGPETTASEHAGTVLVADDDPAVRSTLAAVLQLAGHRVIVAEDGADALGLLKQHRVDVLILDMRMPHVDGGSVLQHLGEPCPLVIVYSAYDFSPRDMREFFDRSPFAVLAKPVSPGAMLAVVSEAFEYLKRIGSHEATERRTVQTETGDWSGVIACRCGWVFEMVRYPTQAAADMGLEAAWVLHGKKMEEEARAWLRRPE